MAVPRSVGRAKAFLSDAADTLSHGRDFVDAARVIRGGRPVIEADVDGVVASEAVALQRRAETRRVEALSLLASEKQSRLGQFFTPERAASLIASLPKLPFEDHVRILDPGAGTGSLSAAIAARILRERPDLELELVAIELDGAIAGSLRETLEDIEQTYAKAGSKAVTRLIVADYIEVSTSLLDQEEALADPFDLIIMNPPYKKMASSSSYRRALSLRGAECPNLYAAFLALGIGAIAPGGQLVAITPRSFVNGPYFRQFRGYLLDRLALDRLHVFESRSTVFSDTGVLQENIIFSGTRDGERNEVVLSVSKGHLDDAADRVVNYSDVVRPGDKDRFIRILSGANDSSVAEAMALMPATLADLDVTASTGRLVDFRSRECLGKFDEDGALPLVYPANVRGGVVEWPRQIDKSQGFTPRTEKDAKLLLPGGYYVVVKRFSAKEERRRVVAAVWDPTVVDGPVAFENHLNVMHRGGAGLDRDFAAGLSYWLNSSLVDLFFRTFSGHTQVNVSDLKSLRFPAETDLRALGRDQGLELPAQEDIDSLFRKALGIRGVAA